ncbi:MAG: peptidylprolyl isomerase [Tannerellaceae bacterium]|nr:peptidylprolyl isomerase [Tannerellaceae bacterium]
MKKILILLFVFVCFAVKAQLPEDSVIMTVAGKQISLAEFEFIAKKNNEVDFSNEKALEEYIELFKNFKLKVAEAESLDIDKLGVFVNELSGYEAQLRMSYLFDNKGEEEVVRVLYDRAKEYIELSQIVIPISLPQYLTKDTVEPYKQAMQVYERIKKGEDFDRVGKEVYEEYLNCRNSKDANKACFQAIYENIPCFRILQKSKVFEEKAYSMKTGEVSLPVRSAEGYHLIKIKDRKKYPELRRAFYIGLAFENDSITRTKEEVQKIAKEVYQKALAGEDFSLLAQKYSSDKSNSDGMLPPVKPGELTKPLEEIVYSLSTPGEVSKPYMTEHGCHIFKLAEIIPNPSFEDEKESLRTTIRRDDRNFDLFRAFDERLKKEYNYTFYPEAYTELEKLAENYFPSSNEFFDKAVDMKQTLAVINGIDFPQAEFAYYMNRFPYSTKPYAGDFMKEVYDLFVRDIVTTLEKENMEVKHPEIPYLIQEYRDGMLLFEISNLKVWSHPVEEQAALEKKWIKELNEKYPVKINRKLLEKLKNK